MRVLTRFTVPSRGRWLAALAMFWQLGAGAQSALSHLDGEFVRRSTPATTQVVNSNERVFEKATGLTASGVTLKELIALGYPVVPSQIAGGPEWIDTTTFDVSIKPHPGEASREQAVQRFLKARFGLAVHSATAPVYILSVSERGSKLAATDLGPATPPRLDVDPGKIVAKSATAKDLAAALAKYLRRPVLDHTRLPGHYDFDLKWRAGKSHDDVAGDAGDPALESALRSDLGLEMRSFPYESLIVDRAELPTGD